MDLFTYTIYTSLLVQILCFFISFKGLFIKLKPKDYILKDILLLETIVQGVEGIFYMWLALSTKNINTVASHRYYDWVITTPTMLFSTIMFMKYLNVRIHKNENNILNINDFFKGRDGDNLKNIVIYNTLMLIFGYMGEIGIINKKFSLIFGTFFFYNVFKIIFNEYAQYSDLGKKLYYFLVVVWGLYGIVYLLPVKEKNIAYNMLDIISKNFYGIYLYYYIYYLY